MEREETLMRLSICAWLISVGTLANAAPPSAQKSPDEMPPSWARFQLSDRKDDKILVAQIQKMDWWKLCIAWGVEARKKTPTRRMYAMQMFLNEQRYINGLDLGNVKAKLPEIGMTTCGAYAVMGLPDSINRSKGAYGTRTQNVWRSRGVYAYSRSQSDDANALIASIQY